MRNVSLDHGIISVIPKRNLYLLFSSRYVIVFPGLPQQPSLVKPVLNSCSMYADP